MKITEAPCTRCGQPTPRQVMYCGRCGHEAQARPGRCHCPACLEKPRQSGARTEEEAARWAFFCTLKPAPEEKK